MGMWGVKIGDSDDFLDANEDDYSEMFGYIQIKAVTVGGKTVTVHNEDLG